MRPPNCDAWCGICRKLVPTEFRQVSWSEPGVVTVEKRLVLAPHFTAATAGYSVVRCAESGKPPWPTPENRWMTVTEAEYAGPGDIPAEEGEATERTSVQGMTAVMHSYPSTEVDVMGLPYGCMDGYVAED